MFKERGDREMRCTEEKKEEKYGEKRRKVRRRK